MTEQEALRKRIMAVEFVAWELHLYLDTHPGDRDACAKLDAARERAKSLRAAYESSYGPLGDVLSQTSRRDWVCGPWPWEGV